MKNTDQKTAFSSIRPNQVQAYLNLILEDGKVVAVTEEEPEADRVIDATGKVVAPGFIDIHMHEDPVKDGKN